MIGVLCKKLKVCHLQHSSMQNRRAHLHCLDPVQANDNKEAVAIVRRGGT